RDPKRVKNFTVDTKQGWTVTFLDEMNLTDSKKLTALQHLDRYWSFEQWYIWVRVEWWAMFRTPVEVEYRQPGLTGYAPTLQADTDQDRIELKENGPGILKVRIAGPAKVEIQPRVELSGDRAWTTTKRSAVLTGYTSHRDISYRLNVNGKESPAAPTAVDENTGVFTLKVNDLADGVNTVELSVVSPHDQVSRVVAERTIFVSRPWYTRATYQLLLAGVLILGALTGIFLKRNGR
ncbi:MAG: hypothetical protein Q7S02_00460, partial [bacterium]|nr:hypothetical protein [bacterium]